MTLKVLVVEDSPTAALHSRLALESQGFAVMIASNGHEALTLARREEPDAILSDILMPDMDGFELLREVRADPALCAIPVLLNSASFHTTEDNAFLANLDADGTLSKDEDPEHLAASVRQAIVARQEKLRQTTTTAILDEAEFGREHRTRMLNRLLHETAQLEHANTTLEHRAAELEAVAAVSAALRTAVLRAEMIPALLDQLLALLKAEGAALALRDLVSGETVIELGVGKWRYWSGERLPAGVGLCGQIIAAGRLFVDNDLQVDPLFGRSDLVGEVRAAACLPLITQGQTIGAVWVGRRGGADIFSESDMRLLTSMSNIAANAIQGATLREQTEQRLQRLSALRAIDRAISGNVDLRFTLNILLDQVQSQLGVDAAAVLLLNPAGTMLEYAAGRGFNATGVSRARVPLGEGYAGRAALERVTQHVPDLTSGVGFDQAGLLAGEGFIAYYGVPLVAKGQARGVLEIFHRAPLAPDRDWLDFLETLAVQAAIAVDSAELFTGLQRSNAELIQAYNATIEGWSRAMDLRDKETEGHSRRVAELTVRLARSMGLDEVELMHMRRGALLHDMGKVGVPDGILRKTGPLTDPEWAEMTKHPKFAYDMLAPIAYLRPALDIPYCHHEKWDGTGYPRGLKGERIPLAARIFAIADVYDALTSNRPYRPAWPKEKALDYIREQDGKHFDTQVVEAFLHLMNGKT